MQKKEIDNRILAEKAALKRRKQRNKEYSIVSGFFVLIFLSLIAYLIFFDAAKSREFINHPYNPRQDTFADRVVRGKIQSSDGELLAYTNVYEDGTEERIYPYSNVFAHVVGFDSHGKSGLESEANFQLLSSNTFFLKQLKNEFNGKKNPGDTVVSTLDYKVQMAAYQALGDRVGAVVAIEPSSGKILAMVSKPDFDPNDIIWQYDSYADDEHSSNLLNRAANGLYPPGSTFKIITSLTYLREHGSLEGYSFSCAGDVTRDGHTIRCYGGTVHGMEDLTGAFASSCNTAYATMGIDLGAKSLRETSESLLFNKKLPYYSASRSSFSLKKDDPVPLVMQTSIGQGNTLVSPLHMAMITSAVANSGVLMKPYLIDSIVNDEGFRIRKFKPNVYGRLMTNEEAHLLDYLMCNVVSSGTASSLSGRSYKVAGKTGSAEYNEAGESHSWFVGYCSTDKPNLAVAVLVEGGGTGSAAAVPIAGQVFDAYYTSHAAEVADENEVDYTDYEEYVEDSSNGWFEIFEEYEEVFTDYDNNGSWDSDYNENSGYDDQSNTDTSNSDYWDSDEIIYEEESDEYSDEEDAWSRSSEDWEITEEIYQ